MFFQLTDNQYLIFSTIKAFTKAISNILKTFILYPVYLGVNNAERLAYFEIYFRLHDNASVLVATQKNSFLLHISPQI